MNQEKFERVIKYFQEENLKMKSIIITSHNQEYKYLFDKEEKINIRSLSKTITSLILGIAIDKGYFKDGVETFIMPYFNDIEITNKSNIDCLSQVKIKHLTTLTMGYEEQILNEKHIATLEENENLCQFALNYPIKHSPGEYFFYTNAPIYLLSIIIEKETGMKLSEFANQELFCKLNIEDYNWLESKQNHSMGCTGLEITPSDLHKIALLFLNDGYYNRNLIISKRWLDEMRTLKIETPNNYDEARALPKFGYGYNFWICKNGIYYHDGSQGQYIIVVPNKDMVITTTADQENMKPITNCMRELFEIGKGE